MKTLELDQELGKLNIVGRDDFYTHLLMQELPFWLHDIYAGKLIGKDEVISLILRRGFNEDEKLKFISLAEWVNDHAEALKAIEPPTNKCSRFTIGFMDGARGKSNFSKQQDEIYQKGYREGVSAQLMAVRNYAQEIGYELKEDPVIDPEEHEKKMECEECEDD